MRSVPDVIFVFIVCLGSFLCGVWAVEHMANFQTAREHKLSLLFYDDVYVYKEKQHGIK